MPRSRHVKSPTPQPARLGEAQGHDFLVQRMAVQLSVLDDHGADLSWRHLITRAEPGATPPQYFLRSW